MIGRRTLNEKPISLSEVLEVLEKEKKGELDYVQRLAYDYAQKFAMLDAEKAKRLKEELLGIEKLREHHAVVITNLMPETQQDLEVIFQKERVRLEEEDFKKILEIVEKYRK
jgi:DNA-directed RNA polymerase subunit F